MDSLGNILAGKDVSPPDEMKALKSYVMKRYQSIASVRIDKQTIILSVPNSALAGTLQLEKNKLLKECGITKKLLIRTGG